MNIEGTYGTMYYTLDINQSVEHYKSKLMIQPTFQSDGWTEFKIDTHHRICLHHTSDKNQIKNGILIIQVKGLKEMYEQLKKNGVKIASEIHQVAPGAFSFDVRDDQGNAISYHEGPW